MRRLSLWIVTRKMSNLCFFLSFRLSDDNVSKKTKAEKAQERSRKRTLASAMLQDLRGNNNIFSFNNDTFLCTLTLSLLKLGEL